MHVMQVLLCLIPFFLGKRICSLQIRLAASVGAWLARVIVICQNGKWHKLLISSERRARPILCVGAQI